MPFPDAREFRRLLESTPEEKLDGLVTDTVLQSDVPFVFRHDPGAYDRMRGHLSSRLDVANENITVIGSGRSGYSLAPDTFAQPFSSRSDVDVLMVDDRLFDSVWYAILAWHYLVDSVKMNGDERRWIGSKQKALYWGWISLPDLVLGNGVRHMRFLNPMREIRTRWFNAFKSLARIPGLEKLDISGRLYRSWRHATLYHVDSLRQVKAAIARTS